MSTFDEIKKRHVDLGHRRPYLIGPGKVADEDRGQLIEMLEALKDIARPVEEMRDGEIKPLVLYFSTEEDRDGMIKVCQDVMPNSRAVKVP